MQSPKKVLLHILQESAIMMRAYRIFMFITERNYAMLSLRNIKKTYISGTNKVEALRGVSIDFRESEFVSILGQSGCGKTTLLNIIGGLDRFSAGDLIISGKSTAHFADRDWDRYRNHSVGFVFQSYNLIPHQSVLKNVELALTLSGVKRAERRRRAIEALERVGLGDQLSKKPNQMSGGQMQRVAIARAIVNDPEILLADEPTGALDSKTSVQVMEILKDISKDRLVVMVTHNPELADRYSSRIIRLVDGEVASDSHPFDKEESAALNAEIEAVNEQMKQRKKPKSPKKKSMSLPTALSLSFNNLLTKKARTFLTAFAGSIGIIGIAMILSLSTGVNSYVNDVQKDTLSSYPISIQKTAADMSSAFQSMMTDSEKKHESDDKIYVNNNMSDMIGTMFSSAKTNDLKAFKAYIESENCDIAKYCSDIQYSYSTPLNIYNADTENGITQANPSTVMKDLGVNVGTVSGMGGQSSSFVNTDVFTQIIGDEKFVRSQFDLVDGKLPEKYNELVLMVGENNEVADYTLYTLGLLDLTEIKDMMQEILDGAKYESPKLTFDYSDILNLRLKLVKNTDYFEKQENGTYLDMRADSEYMKKIIADAEELRIVGIVRPKENSSTMQKGGYIGYLPELMSKAVGDVDNSEIVKAQRADEETDVFTGKPFAKDTGSDEPDLGALSPEQKQQLAVLPPDQQKAMIAQMTAGMTSSATYEENMSALGVASLDEPSGIAIYPVDFEAKDKISAIIDDYNKDKSEDDQITYTDFVGLMMSSVTIIINAISYILIAFVAISLVVSSIMIGVITYISVLERTKEIGVLRSIGASKKDISRVFNAETIIVGLTAGAIGIIVTLLLLIPANIIIESFTGIAGIAVLPWIAGAVLVLISMLLTFIAGLIPAKIAAKKDPVVALRTE